MSESKTSPIKDQATKKAVIIPRSTKTSRARDILLKKQGTGTTPVSTSTPSASKPQPPKVFRATPTASYLANKNLAKSNFKKPVTVQLGNTISHKEPKNEQKQIIFSTPTIHGDGADEDFEIVQFNEINDNHSATTSSQKSVDAKITDITVFLPETPCKQGLLDSRPQELSQSPLAECEVGFCPIQSATKEDLSKSVKVMDQSFHKLEDKPPVIEQSEVNTCDVVKPIQEALVEELKAKLVNKGREAITQEGLLRHATDQLKHLEEEFSIRLHEYNCSQQKLENTIKERNQLKAWVDSMEKYLVSLKQKIEEGEQKIIVQEQELRKLTQWRMKVIFVSCAAAGIGYYYVVKK